MSMQDSEWGGKDCRMEANGWDKCFNIFLAVSAEGKDGMESFLAIKLYQHPGVEVGHLMAP